MAVRLLLFGSPSVERDGASLALPCERRGQLVAYLALKGGWLGRQELACLLWPEQESKLAYERMAAAGMPSGYQFDHDPDAVAHAVLGKSTWAVLGLTLDIEVFTQVHYRSSIEPDLDLSPVWKDVFLFHWREESQHAILDELEWWR